MKSRKTTIVSVRVDVNTLPRVDHLAEVGNMTRSALVAYLIEAAVDSPYICDRIAEIEKEKKERLIRNKVRHATVS